MMEFTCTEADLIHIDTPSGIEVIMKAGEKKQLPDELVKYFCRMGWGTSEGLGVGPRKPGMTGKYIRLVATMNKPSGG